MMTRRFWIAGLVGGVAMFVWASFAHMTPMLSQNGIQKMPAEPAVLAALQGDLGKHQGFYLFPYLAPNETQTAQGARRQAENPSGLLIYRPPSLVEGRSPADQVLRRQRAFVGQSLGEFLFELIEALAATALLATTTLTGLGPRVGFFAGIGVIAALATNGSYLIWFGFPLSFTLSAMFIELMKFVVAGVAAALVLGKTPARA
jgi:hypothetical protein